MLIFCKLRCGWFPLIVLAVGMPVAAQQPAANGPDLSTPPAQASYGIGRQIAGTLAMDGLEGDLLNIEALVLGIRDATNNTESRITQQQFQTAIGQCQQIASQRMQQKMQAVGEKNRRDGPAFIEKYKALEGVQQTPSGVLYKVIKEGDGPSPKDNDVVRTHYRGRLVDGSEFDSSYKRNEPAVFALNQVIKGWTEALQMMKVGGQWQLVIPAEMAYGANGNPPVIGPDAVLIFDIELLGVEPQQAGQAAP